ncbi:M16 family metallopeptidase [Luteibacter sp. NPDC031894]|uniref:M16 family metallopeptidase n=1 Tax=Luteibacter sp. NPDC031894 TaxID=3390572 RepID=UPI003CFF0204
MNTPTYGAALLRAALLASLGALSAFPLASHAEGIDQRSFRLPNGLTVVVHEDHKAPIVSLAVWYRVGSADEPAGRTGLAHLFEHLMFYGSKHYDAPFMDAVKELGGRNINGETWFDRTAYYETVPTGALDKALWLESDRMGHLLDTLDEGKLESQRAIIRNEHRDTLETPYARTHAHILRHLFPANHPYHHDAYGKPADLERATLDDARAWFRDHYGAANATVVMAGDITPERAREKAMAYFGDLAPGPDLARRQPWVVPLAAPSRGVMHDKASTRRIVRAWPVPEAGTPAATDLDLAARILGDGATSRLHTRLVGTGLASKVDADVHALALAGVFTITVDVADAADLAVVESALDDELRRFIADGPDSDELSLAQLRDNTAFLAGTERMDAKAHQLADGLALHGDPAAAWAFQERVGESTAATVRHAASAWLAQPGYTLTVLPAPEDFDAAAEDASDVGLAPREGEPAGSLVSTRDLRATPDWAIDRTSVPSVADGPGEFLFPVVSRSQLPSGARLVSTHRTGSGFAHVRFLFGGGSAADHGRLAGTARFTMAMLDRGVETKAARLGATFETGCEADACFIDLRIPRARLQAGLALVVEAARHAAFRAEDIDILRTQSLAAIDAGQMSTFALANNLISHRLFGEHHPYGAAAFGQGTRTSLLAMNVEALRAYRRDYLRPDNLSVLLVGDVVHEDGVQMLNEALTGWTAPATPVVLPSIGLAPAGGGDVAYLVDRPGARQAHVAFGVVAPPVGDSLDLEVASQVFAQLPGSRLNANLREGKGWSYGVVGGLSRQGGVRTLTVHAPVQADRAGEAIVEIRREIEAFIGGESPLDDAEVGSVRTGLARSLAAALETDAAVLTYLSTSARLGRGDDFWPNALAMLRRTSAAKVGGAFEDLLRTQGKTWVIVGDRNLIETSLREQFPSLRLVDGEGRAIE